MSGMELPAWAAIPAGVLLIIAGLAALLGSIGLLRMRDFCARMHPPTMATTFGTGGVVLASMLVNWATRGSPTLHEVLLGLFLFLTAPVSAMTLIRAALTRTRVPGGTRRDQIPRR